MADMPGITIRKRKYQADMSPSSLDESQKELVELKDQRTISPATKLYFDSMIESFEELKQMKKEDHNYEKQQIKLLRLEAILCSRLEKDANILLRYGDYYKGNLYDMKKQAREKGKERLNAKIHAQKSWKEISAELVLERDEQRKWFENYENGIRLPPPENPTTKLVTELAGLANMSFNDATFQIKEYIRGYDIAHSSIDEAIARNALHTIAEFITRDQLAIENSILPPEMEGMKEGMLSTLTIFENRFFKVIITDEDPETGLIKVEEFEKSEEYIERRKTEEARIKEAQQG